MNVPSFSILRRRVILAIDRHPYAFVVFAVVYILSPVDLLPTSVFGPIGAFDDILVAMMGWAVLKRFWRARRLERRGQGWNEKARASARGR